VRGTAAHLTQPAGQALLLNAVPKLSRAQLGRLLVLIDAGGRWWRAAGRLEESHLQAAGCASNTPDPRTLGVARPQEPRSALVAARCEERLKDTHAPAEARPSFGLWRPRRPAPCMLHMPALLVGRARSRCATACTALRAMRARRRPVVGPKPQQTSAGRRNTQRSCFRSLSLNAARLMMLLSQRAC
jgi:hypothetical protein